MRRRRIKMAATHKEIRNNPPNTEPTMAPTGTLFLTAKVPGVCEGGSSDVVTAVMADELCSGVVAAELAAATKP